MAKLYVSSGRRGRPASIDAEQELIDLTRYYLPRAKRTLQTFREQTKGARDAEFLGTETELPDFIQSTLNALIDVAEEGTITYEDYAQIKTNLNTIRQLASRQQRVYGRALSGMLMQDFERSLNFFSSNASEFVRKYNEQTKEALRQLTPQQRQSYFLSRNYQDPATMVGDYENVRAWATSNYQKKTGESKNLTMQEAWAYLRYTQTMGV